MIFWKWWTMIVLLVTALVASEYYIGVVDFIIQNDPTRITFMIGGLFLLATIYAGLLTRRVHVGKPVSDKDTSVLWFTSDALMSIGMVGTLLGFLMVLTSAFNDIDTSDVAAMQEVIGQLATGMGTALLTSLVGLVSSITLKAQLVMLDVANTGKVNETI